MSLAVIDPKPDYDRKNEGAWREEVRKALGSTFDRRSDLVVPFGKRLAFTSASGNVIYLGYNDDGQFTIQQDTQTPFGLASIDYVSSVESTLDGSIASVETSIRTDFAAADATLSASITTEQSARVSGDAANASSINSLTAVVGTKARVYRQTSAPGGTLVTGDLWFDSDDNNKLYRYSGSAWDAVDDSRIATSVANITTLQSTTATHTSAIASLESGVAAIVFDVDGMTGDLTTLSATVDGHTTSIADLTTGKAEASTVSTLSTSLSTLTGVVGGKAQTFRQTSAPTAAAVGDLWIDSDDNEKLYRWDGSSWVAVPDSRIASTAATVSTQASTISSLQGSVATLSTNVSSNTTSISTINTTLDTKAKTYRQTSAPSSGMLAGDLWFDSDDGDRPYRYNGSAWVAVPDGRIANLESTVTTNTADIATNASAITGANSAIASLGTTVSAHTTSLTTRARIFRQNDAPGSGMQEGDYWLDANDGNKPYRYESGAWVEVTDARITTNSASISSLSTAFTDLETSFASLEVDVAAANDAAAAAATSASTASTKAGEASTSASAAQTSNLSATVAALVTIPSDWASGDQRFWCTWPTDTASANVPSYSVSSTNTTITGAIYSRGYLSVSEGRKVKLTARVRRVSNNTNGVPNNWHLGVASSAGLPSVWGDLLSAWSDQGTLVVADGWKVVSVEQTIPAGATRAYASAYLSYRSSPSPTDGDGPIEIDYLLLEDITESKAAAGSASAAATSATTAGAYRDAAGTYAGAAETAKLAAESAKGSAESARDSAATSASNAAGSASTASTQATNSANSASAAAGSASAASGYASTASTKASEASASASSASGSATNASTSAGNANTYAGQSSSSAANALTSENNAAASALTAGTHASNAAGSASTASGQASIATAAASAASASATLSASIGIASINSSPTFADNANATGAPTGWTGWTNAGAGSRVTGLAPQPYSYRQPGGANANAGFYQTLDGRMTQGWYVVEADVTLVSGTLDGAGVYFDWGPSSGSDTSATIYFPTDTSNSTGSAAGSGTTGQLYRFRKLININSACDVFHLYGMSHWVEGFGNCGSANSIDWRRVAIRAASQAEIEARQAKLDLATANATITSQGATIASNTSAIATLNSTVTSNYDATKAALAAGANQCADSEFQSASSVWTNLYTQSGSPGTATVTTSGGKRYYGRAPTGLTTGHQFNNGVGGGFCLPVTPGERLEASVLAVFSNCTAVLSIDFLDAAGYYSTSVFASSGLTSGTRGGGFATVPSGVAFAALDVIGYATASNPDLKFTQPFLRKASAIQTALSPYAPSQDPAVSARQAATEATVSSHTATLADNSAAIASNTSNISANYTTLKDQLGAGSVNMLVNTDFAGDSTDGWVTGWDGTVGGTITRGFETGSWTGTVRTRYITRAGTPTSGTVAADLITANTSLANLKRFAATVKGGQRIWAGAYLGMHRCKGAVSAVFYDAAGTYVSEVYTESTTSAEFLGGDPANAERVGAFCNAPSNARYVALTVYLVANGGLNPYVFWGWPMIALAAAEQTTPPPYVSGVVDRNLPTRVSSSEATVSSHTVTLADHTSSIATQTTQLSALYGKHDGVVPDADFRDASFWSSGAGLPSGVTFVDLDGGWTQRRGISLATGTYDLYSSMFPVEPGATYRIRCRVWANSGSFSGWFHPLIHMPGWQWFSLKHGTAVDPSTHNSANAIVANSDTLDLEWIVTNATGITNNANRQWQFRLYGSFTGGPVIVTVSIIRLDQYATVTSNTSAIATVDGKLLASYGFTVDAGGRVASMKALSDGTTSEFAFTADSFKVYNGTSNEAPFVVEGGIVKAKKIQAASLSAITATIGLLRTATSGARTEIEDNLIRVYDSGGTLRVRMGVW